MCTGSELDAWMADTVRRLLASGLAEPALLIKDATPARPKRGSPTTFLYDAYDRHWVRRRASSLRRVDLSQELSGVPSIYCQVTTHGKWSQYFSREDVETIRSYDLDFILRFAFNIIRGDVLEAARYGVWSYHHDDERRYRGGPPCFWEIVHGDATTGVILQRLTHRLDGGIVLVRGSFGTCKGSWVANLDQAFWGASDFCVRACAEIASGQLERVNGAPSSSGAPILHAPTHRQLAAFAARCAAHVAQRAWQLLFHHEVWNVAVIDQPLADVVSRKALRTRVAWAKPHARHRFVADPFGVEVNGSLEVLVEDYHQAGKGTISRLKLPLDARKLELKPAIDRREHLSYPCVFVEGGRTFCLPEVNEAARVALYELLDGRWQEIGSLLDGLRVVDPTLFQRDERYWLFYSLQDDGAFGNQKLYAHYADDLFGEWQPHRLNPLKCDIASSRPAGQVFTANGKWYRPAQDCSVTYGGALVIHELGELTPTRFEEWPVARLEPDPKGPYPHGLHTLNALGSGVVIDGKRFERDLGAWRQNAKRLHEIFR